MTSIEPGPPAELELDWLNETHPDARKESESNDDKSGKSGGRRRRGRGRGGRDEDGETVEQSVVKPDHDGRLAMTDFRDAFAKLPDDQREVLALRLFAEEVIPKVKHLGVGAEAIAAE